MVVVVVDVDVDVDVDDEVDVDVGGEAVLVVVDSVLAPHPARTTQMPAAVTAPNALRVRLAVIRWRVAGMSANLAAAVSQRRARHVATMAEDGGLLAAAQLRAISRAAVAESWHGFLPGCSLPSGS